MFICKIKGFCKNRGNISSLYAGILFFFSLCFSVNGQNFFVTEGQQKVEIFEDGSYKILQNNGADYFSFYALDSMVDLFKMEAQMNIIEAEYFVSFYMVQKEIYILETALKRISKEGNTSEINDYKNKIKKVKKSMKDILTLYDNALFFQRQVRKAIQSPEKFKVKSRQKLEAYIASKDYIFKTTKHVRGEVQIWQDRQHDIPDKNISSNQKAVTENVSVQLPEKQIITTGNCRIFKEESDSITNISNDYETVFLFTPQRLKVHLKEENLIECHAQISQTGKDIFLNFRIVMKTKDAAKSYGHIQEGGILRLEFINGLRLNLKASQTVFGSIEEYSGKIVYETKCKLDKEMVKQLQNLPLDYLGIMWSSGFEKYEIFEVDVLMRQLVCLKSVKNI